MRMSTRLNAGLVAALLGLSGSASVFAGNITGTLAVSATVLDACLIVTTPLAFGNYSSSTTATGTGTVVLTCTAGTSGTVTLGQGLNPGTGSTDGAPLRQMASGSGRLGYLLFQDSGRSSVWGNTSPTGVAQTGTGLPTTMTVYGSIPSGQNAPIGIYLDSVVATVTF